MTVMPLNSAFSTTSAMVLVGKVGDASSSASSAPSSAVMMPRLAALSGQPPVEVYVPARSPVIQASAHSRCSGVMACELMRACLFVGRC